MFTIIVFDLVLTRSSPVSSKDLYSSLTRDRSRDVTPCYGVSVIYKCTSNIFLRLPLLRLDRNRCAAALVVKKICWPTSIL